MNYSKFEILSALQKIESKAVPGGQVTVDTDLIVDAYHMILDLLRQLTSPTDSEVDYD